MDISIPLSVIVYRKPIFMAFCVFRQVKTVRGLNVFMSVVVVITIVLQQLIATRQKTTFHFFPLAKLSTVKR